MAATFVAFLPHARLSADGANPFRNQYSVNLLQFDGEKTIEGMLEMDAAIIITAPVNHCRRLRQETPAAPGSSYR